jgi:acetyltransferase-like isoleucine patch superfamily enzyme
MNFIAHQPTNLWGNNKIGSGTTIGSFADIGNAVIGKNCKIQCHVSIPPLTRIKDNVFIGPGVKIMNDKHMNSQLKGLVIGKGAKIGIGAIICANVGANARVGAGAVVIKEVKAGTTVVGNPAKEI